MKLDTSKLLGFRLSGTVNTQATGAKIGEAKPEPAPQAMGAKIGGGKDETCTILGSIVAAEAN